MKVLNYVTQSTTTDTNELIVQFHLSALGLQQLATEKFLGVSFRKDKYKFANDLSEILAVEIANVLLEDEVIK